MVVKRSRDILLKFRDPLHITEMVEARNSKLGMHIDHERHKQTKSKIRSKGIMWGHAIHLCNFGTPLYQGSRHIPNIAILNVVIPNEVVGGDDGGIDKKQPPPTTSH